MNLSLCGPFQKMDPIIKVMTECAGRPIHNVSVTFTPVPNFCEENVWRSLQEPSNNPRWAVFVSTEDRKCTMWAQRTQNGITPVIWDYHVVMLEQTPEGFQVWDPDCTAGSSLSASDWTMANFPQPDRDVRFRIVDAEMFRREFRSDRRHSRGSAQPDWPVISPGEHNLSNYTSVLTSEPGRLVDLEVWIQLISR